MSLSDKAKGIAAKATGLRPDQIERAVDEYRKASEALHDEPEWQALSHMSFAGGGGIHQYVAEGTKVCLQVETNRERQHRLYVFNRKAYESFGESREAELQTEVRPKPYVVAATTAPKRS